MQAWGVPPSPLQLPRTQSLLQHFSGFASKLLALQFSCAARRSLTCSLHYQHPACQLVRRLMQGFWEAALWCYWLGLEGRACLRHGNWNAAGPVAFIGCLCIRGKKNVSSGAGSEDQRIPGANFFFEFEVQDADNESKTCHHAADSDRSGGAFRGNGGAGFRPAPSTPRSSLSGYGKESIGLDTVYLSCLLLHHCNTPV